MRVKPTLWKAREGFCPYESIVEAKEFDTPLEVSSYFELGDCRHSDGGEVSSFEKPINEDCADAISIILLSKNWKPMVEPIIFISYSLL